MAKKEHTITPEEMGDLMESYAQRQMHGGDKLPGFAVLSMGQESEGRTFIWGHSPMEVAEMLAAEMGDSYVRDVIVGAVAIAVANGTLEGTVVRKAARRCVS